jgi:DNA-binding NtrC family response regulator
MDKTPRLADAHKTILLVDDDPEVLGAVFEILEGNNNILTARDGKEALQQSRDYVDEIHLLLSDFQMPLMNGIELATEITLKRPKIKVLLMSGFTGGMLILNEGWHFLPKPFIGSQLRALIVGLISPDRNSKF